MKSEIRKKTMVILALLVIPFFSGTAGNREGNGGDHVRATYIKMGRAIVAYLKDTKEGAELVLKKSLDVQKLEDTLTIDKVAVAEGELKDNGGSDVDAIGVKDLVTLRKEIWVEHFEKERDVYYLVFHEMLRSAGVNDDNYVYSEAINPFPVSLRVATRINPLLPLVDGDLVEAMVDVDQIVVNGTGCPVSDGGNYFDFDSEKNLLDILTDRYKMIDGPTAGFTDTRKACAMAMPLSVPAGKRLVISQLDVAAKVNLPLGGKATINLEAFTAGATGPKIKKTVLADTKPVLGRVQIRLPAFFQTGCGGSPILRLNTSGQVASVSGQTATMKIDRIHMYFKVEDCTR